MNKKVVLVHTDMIDLYNQFPLKTLAKIEPQMPMGIGYLAAVLREHGFEVTIIDDFLYKFSEEALVERILEPDPRLVGFSTTSLNLEKALRVAAALKKQDKRVQTVFGGPHPTMLPQKVMQYPYVDYVVVGEGEYTLLELAESLSDGRVRQIHQIPGLFYRDAQSDVRFTGARPLLRDLDKLPYPARDLFPDLAAYDQEALIPTDDLVATLVSSRGCPFRCTFCSSSPYWDRRFRGRRPERVVDEIKEVMQVYGAKAIYFREDNFTLNRKRVLKICEEIQRRDLDIHWECESRVDILSEDLIARMREAGCRAMWFGLESGVPRILKSIKKDITVEQMRRVFAWCKKHDIATGASFMLGFPGESREDVWTTFELAKELDPDYASFQAYVAFPTSELYHRVQREGLIYYHYRPTDVYIVQTKELRFEEIMELEHRLNEEFLKFRLSRKYQDSPPIKIFLRASPSWLVKKSFDLYHRIPYGVRQKIRKLI